jgi:hypothetical protein
MDTLKELKDLRAELNLGQHGNTDFGVCILIFLCIINGLMIDDEIIGFIVPNGEKKRCTRIKKLLFKIRGVGILEEENGEQLLQAEWFQDECRDIVIAFTLDAMSVLGKLNRHIGPDGISYRRIQDVENYYPLCKVLNIAPWLKNE